MLNRHARAWAALGAALFLAACSSGGGGGTDVRPSNVADICAIYQDNPHWRDAVASASSKWATPADVKMAIIWRESTFRHDARPPYRRVLGVPTKRLSTAYGYSQALDGTWEWYQQETGRHDADRTDFQDAVDFVGWYMNKTKRSNGVPPSDAFNQYLAYHEGHTGYRRGSWRQKPGVLRAAADVQRQAQIYARQRARCGA